MRRAKKWLLGPAAGLACALFLACDAGGVGDPCVPEDEYSATFSGYAVSEVSTESRSFQCATRLCLVNHFQGRVSCPYGQSSDRSGNQCSLPGGEDPVEAPVNPQLLDRRTKDAVYCSCRCAGPDPSARYCECPTGFSCSPVVPNFKLGQAERPGAYCIRSGSEYSESRIDTTQVCDASLKNCDKP